MGGSGKSQIALKFAEENKERLVSPTTKIVCREHSSVLHTDSFSRFQHVFWLDATNTATIERGYKDIGATIRGAEDGQMSLKSARGLLGSLNDEWLLLVDGADDANALSGLWPPGPLGNVLYTSRNPFLTALAPDGSLLLPPELLLFPPAFLLLPPRLLLWPPKARIFKSNDFVKCNCSTLDGQLASRVATW